MDIGKIATSQVAVAAGSDDSRINKDAIRAHMREILERNNSSPLPTEPQSNNDYPKLSEKALYGTVGDIVRTIEPHTEADIAALLVQLLAGFGNMVGRTAYYRVGADFHFTKLFAVLVGATSAGRKGTSWSEIERLLIRVDDTFRDAIQNGLSSGEGLIHHVRDPKYKSVPVRVEGAIDRYEDEMVDRGALEKRAFVIEPEFARVLKVMAREGNTLSSVIRQAWDTDRLSVMTKDAVKATDAHISIVGHITEMELIRHLQETDTANGFANRFLWVCVRRSKYLPDGGSLAENELDREAEKLRNAMEFARSHRITGDTWDEGEIPQIWEVLRDESARELWHEVYPKLSDGRTGLFGSVTSRAAPQVLRIACLYALLDCSRTVRLEHLQAALAVWQYSEDSARYIFGVSAGDKLADRILSEMEKKPEGLTKTDMYALTDRNYTSRDIDSALRQLTGQGRIERSLEYTGGRPREKYKLVGYELNEKNEFIYTQGADS